MCGDGRTARAAADAGHRLQPRAVMQVHPSSGRDGVLLTQLFPWRTGTPLASVDRDRERIAAHITYWGRHLVSHGSGVVAPPARDTWETRMRELTAGMYELMDEVAPGGAGAAHEVRDTRGDSLVRVRLGSDRCVVGPDVERRVEQACRLQHDHIVPVLGLARRGSGQYVVEQPVEGERLDVLLEERRALSPVEALSIARQLADALVYAHEHGVVHGCVSPAAVVIQDAARPRAMLAGFGSTGIILPYVAPERLKGDELEPRADVFGLGLVLFEMLEGRPFFASADEQELRALLLEQTGPLLPQFSRILPPGLSALVARMIRRKATTRSSMVRVRSEIEACLPSRTAAPVARAPKAPAAPAPPTPAVNTAAEPKKRVVVQMPSLEADEAAPERPARATVVAPRVLVRAGVAPRRTP